MTQIDHLSFTGTRKGMTEDQAFWFRHVARYYRVLHHGDCVGADADAHEIARDLDMKIIVHPGDREDMRAHCEGDEIREVFPLKVRDKHIVEEGAVLFAAPGNETGEVLRSGTWLTVRYARSLHRPITVVRPSGRTTWE